MGRNRSRVSRLSIDASSIVGPSRSTYSASRPNQMVESKRERRQGRGRSRRGRGRRHQDSQGTAEARTWTADSHAHRIGFEYSQYESVDSEDLVESHSTVCLCVRSIESLAGCVHIRTWNDLGEYLRWRRAQVRHEPFRADATTAARHRMPRYR